MSAAVAPVLILLATAIVGAWADPDPNNPAPGDVFVEGKPCTIGWNIDKTGLWKTMHIDLMTGDNFDMVSLANIGIVDGTDPKNNAFSYTCPQVTPHSPIYFYQLWTPSSGNKTWTGRFAITDSTNKIDAPSKSTQPDGQKIPWGKGTLVSLSSAPSSGASVVSGTSVTVTASEISVSPGASVGSGTSPSMSVSESSNVFASSAFVVPVATLPASETNKSLATSAAATGTATTSVVVISAPAKAKASTDPVSDTEHNGAGAARPDSSVLVQTGLALGLAVLWFIVLF